MAAPLVVCLKVLNCKLLQARASTAQTHALRKALRQVLCAVFGRCSTAAALAVQVRAHLPYAQSSACTPTAALATQTHAHAR